MSRLLVLLLLVCVSARAAPRHHPRRDQQPKEVHDQRQQGELNIHAQLDNIVVVLIPTSNVNMMQLGLKNKYQPNGFLQMLQKFKDELATVSNEVDPVVASSQEVVLNQEKNEEEVEATVEEMKPEEQKVEEVKETETTQNTPIKEHSVLITSMPENVEDAFKHQPTLSETVQESVLVVSVPDKLKDVVKAAEDEVKTPHHEKKSDKDFDKVVPSVSDDSSKSDKVETAPKKEMTIEDIVRPVSPVKKDQSLSPSSQTSDRVSSDDEDKKDLKIDVKEVSPMQIVETPKKTIEEDPKKTIEEDSKKTIEEGPKKIAKDDAKKTVVEEPKKTTSKDEVKKTTDVVLEEAPAKESSRREKVIRFKTEDKWAPGLMDIVVPAAAKSREMEMLGALCAPGVWDSVLRTCIMPGDRRSRSEISRFLEAFRNGIALPAEPNN